MAKIHKAFLLSTTIKKHKKDAAFLLIIVYSAIRYADVMIAKQKLKNDKI